MEIFVTIPQGDVRDSFIPLEVKKRLTGMGNVRWHDGRENLTEEELAGQIKDAQVCLTGWGTARFTREVLKSAPCLQVIAHTGGTVAPVVDDAAYDRGIRVLSGNEIYAQSVAEGVIGYMLAALRRIPKYAHRMQNVGWSEPDWYTEGLLGQRVGLVGFGAVARYTATMLRAFDVELLIASEHMSEEEACRYGAQKSTLEEIFSSCKVVSLHMAATPKTYRQIGERLLRLLPDGALLINTARGSVVDEEALARALKEGRFQAVLDVFETEPLPMDSPLRGLSNAMLIPHMGGPTMDRRPVVTRSLLGAIARVLAGEPSRLEIGRQAASWMTR